MTRASFDIWRRRLHPDDRLAADDSLSLAVRDGTPLFSEYRIVLPNGITKWILAVGNSIQNEHGETVRMAGLCIDVTVQKEAQRQARHSELRYQALIQQAADTLIVHDLDGRIVEVNQRACDALGYSHDELLQMTLADIVPDFNLNESLSFWNRIEPGKPCTITSTHRRRDGSTIPVEVRFAILELDGEKLMMALASDISTRLQAEEQLLDALHQLEEKELAKTRFLAAAGHDLRQPVAAASLFVDTLRLTSPTPQQSELIEKLKQSMDNFAGLLEHLLDISRFDSGLIKPQIVTFKLAELFDWLERSFSLPAHRSRATSA
jgi:PAS domain S-box-containing protein